MHNIWIWILWYLKTPWISPFSMSCDEQLKLIDKRNKLKGLEELTEYKKGLLYEMVDKGLPKKRANLSIVY